MKILENITIETFTQIIHKYLLLKVQPHRLVLMINITRVQNDMRNFNDRRVVFLTV